MVADDWMVAVVAIGCVFGEPHPVAQASAAATAMPAERTLCVFRSEVTIMLNTSNPK
jgi:hypothetical protein